MSSPEQPGGPPEPPASKRPTERQAPRAMAERGFLRLFTTVGIVGIGVALGAILADNKVQGWIIGLVVAVVTIVLTALLRATRPVQRTSRRP